MKNALAQLFTGCKIYTIGKGQLVISPDAEPRGVHYIHEGYVKTYDITQNGEYQLLALHGPGDFFPLYWSLDEESRQLLFYETICSVKFSLLPKEEFQSAIANDSQMLGSILRYLLQSFRFSQQRIQNLEYLTASERLAFRLLFLAKHFGHETSGGLAIDVPVTYQDLASSISTTRDTVNRVMRQFIRQGLLTRHHNRVLIAKPEKLQILLGAETSLDN